MLKHKIDQYLEYKNVLHMGSFWIKSYKLTLFSAVGAKATHTVKMGAG